ncbi:hypothetical protein VTJ83DRAFT_2482 [Remersonia thermophila]|uniref:Uncharacterized protein n=1 Tax=Remersonia thermophila TaxID=72144 RepID=A0ABR4DIV5_9PEZI
MIPPTQHLNLDVEAISGICGSISIACWVVVFSPQIIENFRRGSAEGLSIQFVIVWLLGDVFNILGAVLQGVLPTMIILAIYYTIADLVLLAQCFYYRGFTLSDDVPALPPPPPPPPSLPKAKQRNGNPAKHGNGAAAGAGAADERTALLSNADPASDAAYCSFGDRERRGSWVSHLSPAVPFVNEDVDVAPPPPPATWLQAVAFNSLAVLMVCAAGIAGWWLSRTYGRGIGGGEDAPEQPPPPQAPIELSTMGQVFGWLCAALYLGSRLPQLLLNWRRKSTEGVSILFFLFACLGNLTYVLSILAFEPRCEANGDDGCRPGEAARIYWQYMLINLSWLAGSAGTLLLDMGIFVQFFMYSRRDEAWCSSSSSSSDIEIGDEEEADPWDQRPVLERNNPGF